MKRDQAIARLAKENTEVAEGLHAWPWRILDGEPLLALQAMCTPGSTPYRTARRLEAQAPLEAPYPVDGVVEYLHIAHRDETRSGRLSWRFARVLERCYDEDEVDAVVLGLARVRGEDDPLVLSLVAGLGRCPFERPSAPAGPQLHRWTPERIWCELACSERRLPEIEKAIAYGTNRKALALQVEALGLTPTPTVAAVMWRLFEARGPAVGPARAWLLAHPEVVAPLLEEVAGARSRRLLGALRGRTEPAPKGLPRWLHPADLPAREGLVDTLRVLRKATLDDPPALSPDHELAWTLFETWLEAGAPSADAWVMWSLGVLGDDLTALKLAPLMKRWPRQRQNARALKGLRVLKHIGTDNALTTLASVARTAKTRSLKQHATEAIEAIARRRGLSVEALQDRLVPDCGIGGTVDYGPRRFTVVLRPDQRLALRDEGGAVLSSPPAKRKTDDADRVREAKAEWKVRRKVLSTTLKEQRERLRQALSEGRPWSAEAFTEVLLTHPLLSGLAQHLVWREDEGEPFRVDDEGGFADLDDDPVELGPGAIRLLHPVELPASEIEAWQEVVADYELLPPFEQLAWPCRRLEPEERGLRALPLKPSAREAWMGWAALRNTAWTQSDWDGPWVRGFGHFGGWQAHLDGGDMGMAAPTSIRFTRFEGGPPEPLGEVPARVLSEAWRGVARAFG